MADSDDESASRFYKDSYVLIALDSDPSMFVKPENSPHTYMQMCLAACYELANSLIFTKSRRNWSHFAVILPNSENCVSLVDFQDNILSSIKSLKEKQAYDTNKLIDFYQRKASLDLSAFFLNCKKKFREIQKDVYKRTIIFITNDDDPIKSDKQLRFTAINEAKDLQKNGIDFELVTLNENFNYSKFYNELLSVLKPEIIENYVEDSEGLFEKLSSLIITKYYQRKLRFYPFLDDKTRFLTINQKSLIRDEKLYRDGHITYDGKIVKKLNRQSAASIEKKYRLKKSKLDLILNESEYLEVMSSNYDIGYTLVHVSDRITPKGLVLRDNVLIEVHHSETLTFFEQFWQFCVDRRKVLVCVRKLRVLDRVRFVEFIPVYANNCRQFMVKVIPFLKEMKRIPTRLTKNVCVEYDRGKMGIAEALIERLSVDYYPKMFTNPVVAKKKAFLRAKLLEEEKEEVKDVTLDCDAIDKCLGDVGGEFKELVGFEVGAKRKAAPRGGRGKRGRK